MICNNSGPIEQTFTGRDVRLHYLNYPGGSPSPLVLLHGGAWCWQEYLSLIPALAEQNTLYALDLRGNGKSGWTPGHYRLRDFTADQEAFLRWIHQPAIMVGHSLGGVIALMVAKRCPALVQALIIEDAPLFPDQYRMIAQSGQTMYESWLKIKRDAKSESELAISLAREYGCYPEITSSWLLFFARCLWQLDPSFFDTLMKDFDDFIAGYDGRDILKNLKCPVLFLRGETERGAVLSAEEEDWLRKDCPHVQVVKISGVGHLLHLNDAGQLSVQQAMTGFLRTLPQKQNNTHVE